MFCVPYRKQQHYEILIISYTSRHKYIFFKWPSSLQVSLPAAGSVWKRPSVPRDRTLNRHSDDGRGEWDFFSKESKRRIWPCLIRTLLDLPWCGLQGEGQERPGVGDRRVPWSGHRSSSGGMGPQHPHWAPKERPVPGEYNLNLLMKLKLTSKILENQWFGNKS